MAICEQSGQDELQDFPLADDRPLHFRQHRLGAL